MSDHSCRRLARRFPWVLSAIASILLPVNTGCWVPYVITVGLGELGILLGSRPITEVLDSNTLDPETEAALRYVLDVRDYAVNVLGLNAGQAFTTFYDSQGQPVVYNISACRKDRFEPYVWWFPIVGQIEYIGFFEKPQADTYAQQLRDLGYDVFMYAPQGYSTMGWFADPLFSEALHRDAVDLAELVIHELAHNTIYLIGNSVFNESVATFIGRAGTLEYLEGRLGADHPVRQIAEQRWADTDLYNRFWSDLYESLNALYTRSDLTSEQKIALRDPIFDEFKQRFLTDYLPLFHDPQRFAGVPGLAMDNALVMIQRRYNLDLDLFQTVYDKLGQDLQAAIQVFIASARAPDPKQYLRDWLAANP
mgnify:CR=1 FL=1